MVCKAALSSTRVCSGACTMSEPVCAPEAAARTAQPARESNIEAIVAYFESGIKPHDSLGELGIELEHTIVHDDLSPVPYSGEHGVAWVLAKLQAEYPHATTDLHGDLLGVAPPRRGRNHRTGCPARAFSRSLCRSRLRPRGIRGVRTAPREHPVAGRRAGAHHRLPSHRRRTRPRAYSETPLPVHEPVPGR